MKLLPLLLSLFLASCTQSVNKENIYGTWTSVESPEAQKDKLTDLITFSAPDKMRVEYLLDQRVANVINAKFTIDKNVLTAVYDSATVKFDISELTKESLVAKQQGTKVILRMRKID